MQAEPKVKVYARVRPLLERERGEKVSITSCAAQHTVTVTTAFNPPKHFTYHHVFGESTAEDAVFDSVGVPAIHRAVRGLTCAIVAYGQTNTGKTHTWAGLLRRTATYLFPLTVEKESHRAASQCSSTTGSEGSLEEVPEGACKLPADLEHSPEDYCPYDIFVSSMQLYNDVVTDLLSGTAAPLTIHENLTLNSAGTPRNGFCVPGLSHHLVRTAEDVLRLMDVANACRTVALTGMNADSSRSHLLFTLKIVPRGGTACSCPEGEEGGQLCFVDLAGCERIHRTHATGQRKLEAQSINLSLAALGNVVHALSNPKALHIPFRDSKLTRVLYDYLAPNGAHMDLILTLAPGSADVGESTSVLLFGERAMQIPATRTRSNSPGSSKTGHAQANSRRGAPEAFVHELETRLRDVLEENAQLRMALEETLTQEAPRSTSSSERVFKVDFGMQADCFVATEMSSAERDHLASRCATLEAANADLLSECSNLRRAYDEERNAKVELLAHLQHEAKLPLTYLTPECINSYILQAVQTRTKAIEDAESRLQEIRRAMEEAQRLTQVELSRANATARAHANEIAELQSSLEHERALREAAVAERQLLQEVRSERDELLNEVRRLKQSLTSRILSEKEQKPHTQTSSEPVSAGKQSAPPQRQPLGTSTQSNQTSTTGKLSSPPLDGKNNSVAPSCVVEPLVSSDALRGVPESVSAIGRENWQRL